MKYKTNYRAAVAFFINGTYVHLDIKKNPACVCCMYAVGKQ